MNDLLYFGGLVAAILLPVFGGCYASYKLGVRRACKWHEEQVKLARRVREL